MKSTKQSYPSLLLFLCLFSFGMKAQNCLPPNNFTSELINSDPPIMHLSWDAPTGGQTIGYLLSYTIDNQTTVTITLPLNTEEFDIILPGNWTNFYATIASICSNGNISSIEIIKKTSLIIVDLVLARSKGELEASVCEGICPSATHFRYLNLTGQFINHLEPDAVQLALDNPEYSLLLEGNTNPETDLFNVARFCNCMDEHEDGFGNPVLVDLCKIRARDIINPALYTLQTCQTISQDRTPARAQLMEPGSFTLFPNPFKNDITLSHLPLSTHRVFKLTDPQGRLVFLESINLDETETSTTLHIPSLNPGIYFYQYLDQSGHQFTGKMLKI